MRYSYRNVLIAALLWWGAPLAAMADAVGDLQAQYRAQGAGPFAAAAGKAMWTRDYTAGGEVRRCSTCHTADPGRAGKHAATGKAIEPMTPAAGTPRLTDIAKIEKWFLRNCKWTVGRECTAQEKGDFLSYLSGR